MSKQIASSPASGLIGGDILAGLIDMPAKKSTLKVSDEPITLPLSKIHTWAEQPRQYFSEASIEQLKSSFVKYGFKGSLTVRPHPNIDGDYQLIAGERRYRAASRASIENVVCFVGDFTDEQALDFALGENLHREDLSKLEETNGILSLIETRFSINPEIAVEIVNSDGHDTDGSNVTPDSELASIVSVLNEYGIKLQTFRTSHLPTLKLQNVLKKAHLEKGLSFLSAKALNKVKHDRVLESLLEQTLNEKWSVRVVREKVKEALAEKEIWNEKYPKSSPSSEKDVEEVDRPTAKKNKPAQKVSDLKEVVNAIYKRRKTIVADDSKMKKIARIVGQLQTLLEEED